MGVCDDTISRQAAIEAVSKECEEFRGIFERCEGSILSLPSAPRWIPVSERLPENERYVLVTTVSGDVIDAKYWQKEGLWVSDLTIISVIAWMPLPKPYKERSK